MLPQREHWGTTRVVHFGRILLKMNLGFLMSFEQKCCVWLGVGPLYLDTCTQKTSLTQYKASGLKSSSHQ